MVIDGSIDFKYLLRLLKTAEKSVMELLTKKVILYIYLNNIIK